ncbi:hypothetical protein Efla_000743 [Eimeria flavescens]
MPLAPRRSVEEDEEESDELEKTLGAGSLSSKSGADDSATSGKSGTSSAADERPAPLSTHRGSSSSSPSSPEASPPTTQLSLSHETEATPSTSSDPGQRRPDPSPRPPAQDPFYRVPALQANIDVIPVEYFGLQPDVPPPSSPITAPPRWHTVSLDVLGPFITNSPATPGGITCILVFMDKLTKMLRLAACPQQPSAEKAAALFIGHVFRHHGLPERLLYDQGPHFSRLTESTSSPHCKPK